MKTITQDLHRDPRRKVWEFLRDCERTGAYINIAIGSLQSSLDKRDRAFATELVNGSIRMRRYLDSVIDSVVDRTIDEETRSILRLSSYEALFMSTADHAIANEYVSLAKKVIGQARAGFINAVMRRILRERDSLDPASFDIGVKTSHPEWIVNAFRQFLPTDELERELMSHNDPASTQVVSFTALNAESAIKSKLTPDGYTLLVPPGEVPEIVSGDAFVQDEGSQVVIDLALKSDPERELQWLDMCAGPGGKFRYLKHFLDPQHLEGSELHPHRAKLVADHCLGYRIHTGDSRDLVKAGRKYDRILLDAPCTGLGALRRRPDSRWRRTEKDLKALITLQRELLDSAVDLLQPDGVIAYVTCSPHVLETKVQVADFLRRHGDFRVRPIDVKELPERLQNAVTMEGMLQLLTGRHGTDGMFLALLERER